MILGQLIRYGLTGVVHNVGGFLLYLLATYLGAEPKLAMSVLFVVGVAVSFLLNRAWAFGDSNPIAGSLGRFLLAYVFGYLLNLAALLLLVDRLGYPHQWVQGFATIAIAGVLFLLNRYFVFNARRHDQN
jgi:putative flippase GtrA